jgi:acyl-CoA synthetase (NDP forming)
VAGETDTRQAVASAATARKRGRDIIERALAAGAAALDEREAKALLAQYDIPTPLGTVVHTAEEAARAFRALGRPAVLKALGADIQHKSDRGLVAVDLRDEAAVRTAFHRLVDLSAGRAAGVLVEEMVPHERELLVGMRRDEQFGTVVAFGLGGIFTEVLHDVAFALAPLDEGDAQDLIAQLAARRLLGPVRGLPRVDTGELARIIGVVAQMAADHPEVAEIDVNPLLVSGDSLVAADALVILRPPAAAPAPVAGVAGQTAGVAALADAAAQARSGPEAPAAPGRQTPNLDAVFAPRGVAVVGASDDVTKWGGSLLRNLIDGGYTGRIYPVNPRGGTIFDLPAAADLNELPGPPTGPTGADLAVVALGAAQATAVVEACGRRGIPAAMVIAAGFGEAGPDGVRLEQDLACAARKGHVTLIGPNCMGVLANSTRLNAVGFVTLRPAAGPLSVVSQSGNIGTQLLMAAERRGVGLEKYISTGNQALTDASDVLEYLIGDPHTGVIAMYVEGLDDGRRFFEVARRATLGKPLVVMRGGMTAYGRRAASSHTGAMAGSAEIFRAAVRQAGVLLAADPDEAMDLAACLAYLPLPRGPRVAVVTLGGGWGVLTADALAASGLELADLPADILAACDALLPSYWSHGNPIDLVASVRGGVPERIIETVAGCDAVDSILALALVGSPATGRAGQTASRGAVGRPEAGETDGEGEPRGGAELDGEGELNDAELALLRRIAAVMDTSGKPVIAVPLVPVVRSVFPGGASHSPVLLPTPTAAVRALRSMTTYAEHRPRHSLQ